MLLSTLFSAATVSGADLRIGIIGCDTSHVPAFTELLNDPQAKNHVPGGKVVAAFRGGSPDLPESANRIDKFSATLKDKYGVKFYDTIEELCQNVDAVMLESVDGRPHLEQVKPVIQARKPVGCRHSGTAGNTNENTFLPGQSSGHFNGFHALDWFHPVHEG